MRREAKPGTAADDGCTSGALDLHPRTIRRMLAALHEAGVTITEARLWAGADCVPAVGR